MTVANQESSPDVQAGLRRLATVVGVCAACFVFSYAVPALERFRPWLVGEGVPVARMFVAAERALLPGFAEAGSTQRLSQDQAAAELGVAVASHLEHAGDGPVEPGVAPQVPVESKSGPKLHIAPTEYEGLAQPLENVAAMDGFYAALRRTATRQQGALTRVAHYGDSAVAADAITHTARRRLQRRFGDAGHGFVLISRGNMHYGHKDIRHRASDGWDVHSLVRRTLGTDWYGYGGIQYRGSPGQYALFETVEDGPVGRRFSRVELYYQRYPRGGKFQFSVDGDKRKAVSARAKKQQDAWEVLELPDGPHRVKVRIKGPGLVRLYGIVFEREGPGLVYDSLGLVGARAQRLLNAEPEHMKRQIARRDPDLLVLGFGGNEAGNKWLDLARYERDLVEVIRVMRAGKPSMSCLLFGPLDQGERNRRGRVVTLEKLPQIVEVQRRVAKQHGCAFFDTFQAMGGPDSVRKWYRARPRLMLSDLRHATPKGYEVVGNMYYKALLKGFAEYLERKR